jgi:hypothetical protein
MKKIISFILLITTLAGSIPSDFARADTAENEDGSTVNLGNFGAQAKGICDNIQKLGAIMNAFQIINWQAIGMPAVVLGMSQRANPLMDFCAYLTQLDQLSTEDAIFFSANYLNELTDAKAEEHISWARNTWTLKNSIQDGNIERLKNDPSSFSNNLGFVAAYSSELNDWIDNTYYIGTKTASGKGERLGTRTEREMEMQMIAQESAKSALYSSSANCANSDKLSDKQRGKEITEYQKSLDKHKRMMDKEQEAVEFYTDRMRKMTAKIAYSQDNQKEYLDMIDDLRTKSIRYRPPTSTKVKYTTMLPVEEKRGGKVTYKRKKDGQVVYAEKKVERVAYIYKLEYNDALIEKIREELSSKWKSYVTANLKSKGLLKINTKWNQGSLSAWEEVEEEFVDRDREKEREKENETENFNFTCAEKRVQEERGIVRLPNEGQEQFNVRVKIEVDRCLKKQQITMGEAKNLMNYYVQQTINSLRRMRQSEAEIWTMESKLLGRNRLIPLNKNNPGSAIEAKCDDKLEPGQIMELQLKQQAVTNNLISSLAKNDSQRRVKEDIIEAREREESKEIQNRRELSEERTSQNAKNIQEGNRVFSVKGLPSSRK